MDYAEKMEARKARLEARLARLNAAADAQWRKGDMREEVSGIPFGQPILVGHHSEGKHRRAIARAQRACERACELMEQAKRVENQLAGVGAGGISADDPEAIAKLKAKAAALEEQIANENAWNKAIRAGRFEELPEKVAAEAKAMIDRWPYMARKFFHVENRRAKLKAARDRIAILERAAARAPAAPIEREDGVRVVENAEANRVQVFFPGKPDADVRAIMKGRGFRWAPSEGAWQRQLNNAGIYAAKAALAEIDRLA